MLVPRRSLIAALFALPAALAVPGRLLADTLREIMPTAKKVGEARFKVFLFKIYDAELFAPDGRFDRKSPYALRLNYLLDAKKDRIISSTVKEMKRQKAASSKVIEGWVPLMEDAFISKFGIEIGSVTIVFLRGRTAAAVGPLDLENWPR